MLPNSFALIITILVIFSAAICGGLVARRFGLPALLGYIAGGILLGNLMPNLLERSFLDLIAEVGVTLLLFTLGVEFSFWRLRAVLSTIAWAALLQIFLTTGIFLSFFWLLNFTFFSALLFALAASLSSTALIVRFLMEKGELETLPGEILTGWLIIQDLAVVPIMLLLPALGGGTAEQSAGSFFITIGAGLVKSGLLLVLVIVLGRRAIPYFLNFVAILGNREIFLLTTVGIVGVAGLITYSFGLSPALGAFLAGLLVSETSQNHAVFSEVRPLRDIFTVIFLVSLGMLLPMGGPGKILITLLTATVAIFLIKGIVIFGLLRFLHFHRKVAFIVALGLFEMSEFGFVIAKEGNRLGLINQEDYGLLVGLSFATILSGTFLLSQREKLYDFLVKILGKWSPEFWRDKNDPVSASNELSLANHVVICGCGRVGGYISRALAAVGIPFVVIDYNQTTVTRLRQTGLTVLYGDPADLDLLDHAQVDLARVLVIAIPDRHSQEMIIVNAQTLNKRIKIICRSHHPQDYRHLTTLGVATVVQPELEAALSIASGLLTDFGLPAEEVSRQLVQLQKETVALQ